MNWCCNAAGAGVWTILKGFRRNALKSKESIRKIWNCFNFGLFKFSLTTIKEKWTEDSSKMEASKLYFVPSVVIRPMKSYQWRMKLFYGHKIVLLVQNKTAFYGIGNFAGSLHFTVVVWVWLSVCCSSNNYWPHKRIVAHVLMVIDSVVVVYGAFILVIIYQKDSAIVIPTVFV